MSGLAPVLAQAQTKLSAAQIISVARSPERTLSLWVGAVSAGKTIASLFAFLIAVLRAPEVGQIVIVGKTLQSIERNVIAQLQTRKLFGPLADQVIHTKGSNTAIILGKVVELIGANNASAEERIRGGTFSLIYVDEATIIGQANFDMLVTRLRVNGARMIATTNPGSKNHWLRTGYILRAVETDLILFRLTMYDNPLYAEGGEVGPSYIRRMEATYTGVFYDRFILGKWTTAEGAVYGGWDADEGGANVRRWAEIPPLRRIIGVGIDYGVTNPTVALMLGITDERDERGDLAPRLILLDEWCDDPAVTKMNRSPSEHGALFRQWLPAQHWPTSVFLLDSRRPFIIVDPSAKGFREELARPANGAPGIMTTPADNAVMEGISDVSNLISRAHPNGGRLFQSTTRTPRWNDEVTEYRWDPKKSEEDGVDAVVKLNDHAMDAGRYAVRSTKGLWLPLFRTAYGLAA